MDGGMWGTIVGGVLGFMASVLPKLFEIIEAYFKHRQDHEDQAQQIDAATKGIVFSEARNTKITVPVEGEVLAPGIPGEEPLDTNETTVSDVIGASDLPIKESWVTRLVDIFRYSVRPLVTYGFFGLFLFIKLRGMYQGFFIDHTPAIQLLPVIWDEGAESMFAAVLAFWFGTRAFERSRALLGKGTPS